MIGWFKIPHGIPALQLTIAKAAIGYSPYPDSKALFLKPTHIYNQTQKSQPGA